jgi:hypothetical protein
MRLSAIVSATGEPPTLARCVIALENGPDIDEVIVVTDPREAKAAKAREIDARRWVEVVLGDSGSSTVLNLGWRHRASAISALGAAAGIATRRSAVVVACARTLVILNRRLYSLLLRRTGPRGAAAGVGLRAVHDLVGVAAVPVGITKHLVRGRG